MGKTCAYKMLCFLRHPTAQGRYRYANCILLTRVGTHSVIVLPSVVEPEPPFLAGAGTVKKVVAPAAAAASALTSILNNHIICKLICPFTLGAVKGLEQSKALGPFWG